MIRPVFLSIAVVCLAWAPAQAGLHCELPGAVKTLERIAAKPNARLSPADEYYGLCLAGVARVPKLRTRFEAACSVILARDPKHYVCVDIAARSGIKQLGGIDVFDAVGVVMRIDPFAMGDADGQAIILYRTLADPRALPIVVQVWKDNLAKAAKRERRPQSMVAWSAWRQEAAKILGMFGGLEDKAFLDEQRAGTKDKYVRRACADAIRAIEQRLAAANPP